MSASDLSATRHTLAHVLAAAVLHHYPHAKLAIGPATDTGFYYDIDFSGGDAPREDTLAALEATMRTLLPHFRAWSVATVTPDEAKAAFPHNPYKQELVEELTNAEAPLTLYTMYDPDDESFAFTDLCRGGHAPAPHEIDPRSFCLDSIAGAYWRGDESKPMLTRIYGLAFKDEATLAEHLGIREEAKRRDHRKLGKELDLFTFSDLIGPGLPLFTPRGTLVRQLVVEKINQLQHAYGYQNVTIPHLTKHTLYETSGHWEKFGDELFKVYGKNDAQFVMKPMNCPHHTQLFASAPRSYRDLPIRYAETTMVYRDEQAGELLGLSRVRSITQDDGHVFCTLEQVADEVTNIVRVIEAFYRSLDMYEEGKFWVSLSVRDQARPADYLGDGAAWTEAEQVLHTVASDLKLPFHRVEGEAAFYGPKLDFMFFDALGRERQLATVQLDFVMPERFGLRYVARDGSQQTPVMIHRAIAGSLERFMAIMIEHFAGAFPFWLAPIQLVVIPVSEAAAAYAASVRDQLTNAGFRAELDASDESLGKRIRNAKKMKPPYIAVLGETEMRDESITLDARDTGERHTYRVDKCLEYLRNTHEV